MRKIDAVILELITLPNTAIIHLLAALLLMHNGWNWKEIIRDLKEELHDDTN